MNLQDNTVDEIIVLKSRWLHSLGNGPLRKQMRFTVIQAYRCYCEQDFQVHSFSFVMQIAI